MSDQEWMGTSTQTNDSSIDYYDSLESYFNRGCYIQQDLILDEFYNEDKSERYASMMYLHNYMRREQENSNNNNSNKASTFSFSQLEKHSDALSQLQKRKQSSIGQMYLQQLEKQKQLKTNIMKKVEARLSGIASSDSLSTLKERTQPNGNFCDLDRLNQTGQSPGKVSNKQSQVSMNSATQSSQQQQQIQLQFQQSSRGSSSSFLRRKETQLFEPMVTQEQLQQQYFYAQRPASQLQLHSMPSTSNILSQQSPSVSPSRNRPIKHTSTQEDDNITSFSASKQRKVVVMSPAKPSTAVLQLRNQYKQLREASREVSRRSSIGNTVQSMSQLKGAYHSDYFPEHINMALPFSATSEQQNQQKQTQQQLSHPGKMMNNFIVSSSQFPYQHAQMLMQTQQQLSQSQSQVSIQQSNPQPLILNKNVKTFSKIFQSYSKIIDDPESPQKKNKDQLAEHLPSSLTLRHYQRKYIPSHASTASLTMPSEELDPEKYEQISEKNKNDNNFNNNNNNNNNNNADGNSNFNNIINMQATFSSKG